jgi:hypothetical protein
MGISELIGKDITNKSINGYISNDSSINEKFVLNIAETIPISFDFLCGYHMTCRSQWPFDLRHELSSPA